MQIQILITIILIVGAAIAALACDILRARHVRSREETAAPAGKAMPKARSQTSVAKLPALVQEQATPAVNQAPQLKVESIEKPLVREASTERMPAGEADFRTVAGDPTPLLGRRRAAAEKSNGNEPGFPLESGRLLPDPATPNAAAIPRPAPVLDEKPSAYTVSQWLIERAAIRAARKIAAEIEAAEVEAQLPTAVLPAAVVSPAAELPTMAPQPIRLLKPLPIAQMQVESKLAKVTRPAPTQTTPQSFQPVTIDSELWSKLFPSEAVDINTPEGVHLDRTLRPGPIEVASQAVPEPEAPPAVWEGPTRELETALAPVREASVPASIEITVPAGMHTAVGLVPLIESRKLFTGLAISIGATVSAPRQGRTSETLRADVLKNIEAFVAGLLGPSDFGCRTNDDEFLLICPGLQESEAQSHLSSVSERLWDYQLRTLGACSILFNLGGVDVQREPLSDTIAAANERMYQTRRSHQPLPGLSAAAQNRRAVG